MPAQAAAFRATYEKFEKFCLFLLTYGGVRTDTVTATRKEHNMNFTPTFRETIETELPPSLRYRIPRIVRLRDNAPPPARVPQLWHREQDVSPLNSYVSNSSHTLRPRSLAR